VPARIAPPPCASRLEPEVAVVEDRELLREQVGDGRHVGLDVGDHAHADHIGDVLDRVGVHRNPVDQPLGLALERLDGLGATGDAEVVDAGVVEQRLDHLDVASGRLDELGVTLAVLADGVLDEPLVLTPRRHVPILPRRPQPRRNEAVCR
jgi:hypothetical protein